MKQFIVLLATLPLTLIFLVQFALDQTNEMKIAYINSCVYSAKEEAKQEGCFTSEMKEKLEGKITGGISGLTPSDVCVSCNVDENSRIPRLSESIVSEDTDWDNSLIHYNVKVTLGGILAGSFVKRENNYYCYEIDEYTASEYLP